MTKKIKIGGSASPPQKNVLLGVCGYERRSTYFTIHDRLEVYDNIFLFDYASNGVGSYDENKELLDALGNQLDYLSINADTDDFISMVVDFMNKHKSHPIGVTIDISAMDRRLLALILVELYRHPAAEIEAKIRYFVAQFMDRDFAKLDSVISFGPVLPELSGSSGSSSERLCLVVGAGYDPGKVIGSIDSLEPDEAYVFRPSSMEKRYEAALDRSNSNFEFLTEDMELLTYPVEDPGMLFNQLHSILQSRYRTAKIIMIPMGPKIFSAISIVVALQFHPFVQVWRYSTIDARLTEVLDSLPSGQVVSLDILFQKNS